MNAQTYSDRRRELRASVPDGAILILANTEAPKNYTDNVYPFRQDSHFLYYVGVNEAEMAALFEQQAEMLGEALDRRRVEKPDSSEKPRFLLLVGSPSILPQPMCSTALEGRPTE